MVELGVRRILVDDGADVVEALDRGVGAETGWVLATGVVEDVELRVAGAATDPVRTARGRFTMVSLSGPTGGPYQVTLARAVESGIEVVGGTLRRARAESVSAAMLPGAPAAEPRPSRPPAPAGWAERAVAAAAAASDGTEPERYRPAPGELVHHFAFGLCDVLKSSGDTLTIRDVKGPARIREIRVDLLHVQAPVEQAGRRCYRLTRKS